MDSISRLDGLVRSILLIAALRGTFIGMIREGFSIATLARARISRQVATATAHLRTLAGPSW